ncbi:zinc finger protein 567-like isoform X2 [Artemia franciscana]|uniref:Uncharacterized protein n=1 Tax=Artemia franciscana TaxID=6661 RepID=A0AA88IHK5_ARTSF|nr:hypothetical protein QYM36_008078 [Artemia franciscana]
MLVNEETTFIPGPILKLQNDYSSENLSNILTEKIFGEDTDMVFHFAEGSLRCHKLILCPKSPLLYKLTSNSPLGSELHFSCPDVRLSTFQHMIELIYLGITKITDSEIEELKSVAKIFMISFGQSEIVKLKLKNPNSNFSRKEFVSKIPDRERKTACDAIMVDSVNDHPINEKGYGKDELVAQRLQQDIGKVNINGQIRTRKTNFSDHPYFNQAQKRTLSTKLEKGNGQRAMVNNILNDDTATFVRNMESKSNSEIRVAYKKSGLRRRTKTRKEKKDGVKKHMCPLCAIQFDSVMSLKSHDDSTHMKNGEFLCVRCDYATPVKDRLFLHHLRHTEQDPNSCKVCGKQFLQRASLINHMKKHSGIKDAYTCFLCEATFDSKKLLKLHRVSAHQKNGIYFCSRCGKTVDGLQNLYAHFKSHSDEFSYPCSVCPKKFRRDALLRSHMRTHIEKELYQCENCGKELSSSECVMCNDCFLLNSKVEDSSRSKRSTKSKRTHHVRPEIEKSKSGLSSYSGAYVCHICGHEYIDKKLFEVHIKYHNDEH